MNTIIFPQAKGRGLKPSCHILFPYAALNHTTQGTFLTIFDHSNVLLTLFKEHFTRITNPKILFVCFLSILKFFWKKINARVTNFSKFLAVFIIILPTGSKTPFKTVLIFKYRVNRVICLPYYFKPEVL